MKGVSILITGDFAPHGRVLQLMGEGKEKNFYNDFQKHLDKTDFNITNLECPLTNNSIPLDKIGPVIKAPKANLELLKIGKFNVATLANNHILDYGKDGLEDTLDACHSSGVKTVGAGLEEKELTKPLILEANEKKIGIINIAEGEFSVRSDLAYGANPFDISSLFTVINKLKNEVDSIIVIPHGGHEFYKYPSPEMVKRYRLLIDFGADLVVAHHPHCYSGYEKYNNGLIFYSLGNFSFDWPSVGKPGWNDGFAVSFYFNDQSEITFKIIPYKQGLESPGIRCLTEIEALEFNKELNEINEVIASEQLLLDKWKLNVKQQSKQYLTLIQPTNRYIKALQSRGWFPKPFYKSKRNRLMLYNLIKNKSHRELLLDVLEMKNTNRSDENS